jgi:hypothetical protein
MDGAVFFKVEISNKIESSIFKKTLFYKLVLNFKAKPKLHEAK